MNKIPLAEIWVMTNDGLGWDVVEILLMINDGYDWIRDRIG